MAGIRQGRLDALTNLAGLGLWAGSQLLLAVTLASTVSLDLVGVFYLGLTVFSLLMIALGLNLRVAIAVDDENRIAAVPALVIRLVTSLLVCAVALAAMKLYAHDAGSFGLAACLIGARIADQLVDIAYGFHQKSGRTILVSLSFAFRGVLTVLLCLALFLKIAPVGETIAAGCALYLVLSLLPELMWFRRDADGAGGVKAVLTSENVRSFSMYPVFDTLHFSSFRLAVAPLFDARTFGLYALAMNAFSAAQVVIGALGLTSLSRLKAGAHAGADDPARAALREAAMLGGLCTAFFALCSLGFAGFGAAAMPDPRGLALFLIGNFAALLLLPVTGFLGQTALFFGNRTAYWRAPLAGALAFAAGAMATIVTGRLLGSPPMPLYALLCAAFLVSSALRIGISLQHAAALRPADG